MLTHEYVDWTRMDVLAEATGYWDGSGTCGGSGRSGGSGCNGVSYLRWIWSKTIGAL